MVDMPAIYAYAPEGETRTTLYEFANGSKKVDRRQCRLAQQQNAAY